MQLLRNLLPSQPEADACLAALASHCRSLEILEGTASVGSGSLRKGQYLVVTGPCSGWVTSHTVSETGGPPPLRFICFISLGKHEGKRCVTAG